MRFTGYTKCGIALLLLFAMWMTDAQSQEVRKVLFIGNSYTQVNNLPHMVANIAASMGDTMEFCSNAPGGCTFEMHCQNQSMTMICEGGWDFVVMQEQSQLPAFPIDSVERFVFPFAKQLVDSVYAFSPHAEPMFYMTWGRKNGDTEFGYPPMDTYEGMDSLLYSRYMQMGEDNDASVCPVGRVWHYLRDQHDEIELYQADGSHPSLAGSYAAACTFYTMLFGRDPNSISFDAGLGQKQANAIRSAAHAVVFDSLWKWKRPISNALPIETSLEVSVSPNPVNEVMMVHLPNGQAAEIILYDALGRERWRDRAVGPSCPLPMLGLPKGLYVLRVVTKEGVGGIKVIKQ